MFHILSDKHVLLFLKHFCQELGKGKRSEREKEVKGKQTHRARKHDKVSSTARQVRNIQVEGKIITMLI